MKGPITAMVWELWRTGRMEAAARLGYALLLVTAIGAISGRSGENVPLSARGLIVLLSSIAGMGSIVWIRELDRSQDGFSFRLGFARPVRTLNLVTVPLLFTILLTVACYIIPVTVFSIIGQVTMPILPPLALVICMTVCCVGMAWGTRTIADRAVGLVALLTTMSLAIVAMHNRTESEEPFLLAIGNPEYYQVNWVYYATLTAITLAAFALTLKSVSLQRQGAGVALSTSLTSLLSRRSGTGSAARQFRSPITAQLAYEFRNCSTSALLFGTTGPIAIYVVIRFSLWINPDRINATTLFEGAPVMWMLGLLLSPGIYQLVATDSALGLRARTGTFRFSAYDATRPMTNGQLVAIKLTAIAACSFLAWLPMWCGSMLYAAFSTDGRILRQLSTATDSISHAGWIFWPATVASVLLLYVSGSCMLLTFGLWMPVYAKRFVAFCCLAYAHVGFAFFGSRFDWPLASFWHGYAFVAATVVVLLSVRTIARALRHEVIPVNVFLTVFAAWVVLMASLAGVASSAGLLGRIPLSVAVLFGGLMFLPLAAPAAAPMAMQSQRHQ